MADKKISQLTALSAANVAPATDVLAIVDTSATETKKITAKDLIDGALNGGTANGVLYLNGSKVATSGSALTFDGSALGVSSASNNQLTLNAVSASTGTRITFSRNSTANTYFGDAWSITGENLDATALFTTGTNPLIFGIGTEQMRLTSTGLGIGTTSPGVRLDVIGTQNVSGAASGTATGTLVVKGAQSNASGLVLTQNNSTDTASITNYYNSPLIFGTNNTERGRFSGGGYFKASDAGTYNNSTGTYHELRQTANDTCAYISATNASMAFNVIAAVATRGASSAFNFLSCAANSVDQFYVRGDGVVYAQNTTIQSISDARLKENVRDASEGLNVINALRSVRYDWKEGFGNNRKDQLGFIAQEVEAVFPDAVSEWKAKEGEEAYKTVGPAALIPVLVKAIQELSAKVAALEAK